MSSKGMKSLRSQALGSCKWRGHTMRRFKDVKGMDGRIYSYSECVKCGADVDVCENPAPNGIDVGGSALAVTCLGTRHAYLVEENRVRKMCGQPPVDLCSCCHGISLTISAQGLCAVCNRLSLKELNKRERSYAWRKEYLGVPPGKDKCMGCCNEASPAHPCPYQEELNGDSETLCNCCPDCTHRCAYDI